MVKRMIIMLVVVAIVLGGIFGFQAFKAKKIKEYFAANGAPPQTVSTVVAKKQEWQSNLQTIGSLRAVNGADLSFEVPGIVDEIDFQSGDEVKPGQMLVHLVSDDDTAKLRSLSAVADLAHVVYDRDQKQLAAHAVSQATVDADSANLKNAQAQVTQQQAVLNKKTIKAPFAGRLGIRSIDLGQYVNAGVAVVTLQALDPIFVDFSLPEQSLANIKAGMPVELSVDTYPGQKFQGSIAAVNSRVDASTRNIQVRATLKNPDKKLIPGMYAKVEVDTQVARQLITLPQTAITYNAYGDTIYLVDEKKGADGKTALTARQEFVTVGDTRGDQVAIVKGVNDGDTVVTAGQVKLRNGSPLLVNNDIKTPNDANPKPIDR